MWPDDVDARFVIVSCGSLYVITAPNQYCRLGAVAVYDNISPPACIEIDTAKTSFDYVHSGIVAAFGALIRFTWHVTASAWLLGNRQCVQRKVLASIRAVSISAVNKLLALP